MADNGVVAGEEDSPLHVRLLGPFSVSRGDRTAGPWSRPSARRLCELVLVSSGKRVTRDLVCEELFADLDPRAAARAVSKALSMTRAALAALGEPLLEADLNHIWATPWVQVDADAHEAALRAALAQSPGRDRDDMLVAALAEDGELLADEPYADWALEPRDRLETLRQQARLTLARDRAKGAGQARPEAVLAAWEACFAGDPACEEAAIALVRAHFAGRDRESAVRVFERCAAALGELGLKVSGALEEAFATAAFEAGLSRTGNTPTTTPGELRTVSILSAQLAVPVGRAGELGMERLREIVAGSVAAVITEAQALGGTITSVSGDGVQAVFGAPEAHEDDPERAVRAAFRALAAAQALTLGGSPMLRIGIETGPAVLGPIGSGGKVEYAAVGEVVSAAAALRSLADSGSALVGPVTRAAVGHLFTWGASEQTATYLGVPRPDARGRPSGLGGSGPMVGRRAELSVLDSAMRGAIAGNGSMVVVTGEPGLGKTRLVQEFRKLVTGGRGRPPLWLEGRCASYASSTPYSVYQQLLANWSGVTPDLPEAVVRPALERTLSRVRGAGDLFPPLARMMGLPSGAALGRLAPEEIHRATFAAWRSLIARLVAAGPVVLVLEDLHWADPTSRQLTDHLAVLAARRKLLIVITSRSDADPVTGAPGRRVALRPLSGEAERALAGSLIGSGASPQTLDAVLASVDGNPLFLEERLTSLLETKALVRSEGEWRISEAARQEVPQALERLVRSRIDRLSPAAIATVRHASVLGSEFPLSLLAAVRGAGDSLGPALDELRAKDILHDVDGLTEPAFRFRHALIQEATYSGMLGAERRLLHGRAAWALEAASRDRLEDVASVLGRHFAAAGESVRALSYLEMAGDHATSAFANDEAISSFRSALEVAEGKDAAVELRAKLANVLWRTGRRDEARQAFREALELADDGVNTLRTAHLRTRLGRLEMADLRFDAAEEEFAAAESLLGDDPGSGDVAVAEQWLELMVDGRSALCMMSDDPERALASLAAVRPVLETRGSPARKCSFYMHLAYGQVMSNRFVVGEAALADMRKALEAALRTGEDKDEGYERFFLGQLLSLRGDLGEAQDQLEQALALAERIGESILIETSLIKLAQNALRRHDTEAVRALAPRALEEIAWTASSEHLVGAKGCLTWLAWRDGRPDEVLALAGEIAEAEMGYEIHHQWVWRFPLAATHLDAGRVADAIAAARELLDPAQLKLPDALTSALEVAFEAWDHDQPQRAARALASAITLASDLRFC